MHPEVTGRAFENATLADLEKVGGNLMQAAGSLSVFVFHGDLGSGKTTVI
jgi:tRNA A37 threonylcarbamoyladenosine biosynthesis protein TsaE